MSATTNQSNSGQNSGYDGEGTVLRMDEKRSRRFCNTLSELYDTNESLRSMTKHFNQFGCNPGEIDHVATVRAFTDRMDKLLSLAHAMVNAQEHLNDDMKEV
jgi:hypothetical protein